MLYLPCTYAVKDFVKARNDGFLQQSIFGAYLQSGFLLEARVIVAAAAIELGREHLQAAWCDNLVYGGFCWNSP